MTTPQDAVRRLLHSRDADQDAAIWHDNGRSIVHLARQAGVVVMFAHVDLATLQTTYRTVDGREVSA